MRDVGYLESAPADGKALIDDIMSRKAISEFRWTTVDEIVSKGGALVLITKDEYEQWFAKLSPTVREKTCTARGYRPGKQ
ncbi:MAG: cobaltochelatase subunit CobN [Methanophagales archaeon]|nr:cobaltochelatase subunit CobN [Methanophagales archaeon]